MTTEYPKIQTVFKRDPNTDYKTLLEGEYSEPAFEYLKDNKWLFTEKVDGTNIRVCVNPCLTSPPRGEVIIQGKTNKAQTPPILLDAIFALFDPEEINKTFYKNRDSTDIITLYGEGYGPKIQSGGKYREDNSFVLFDVKIGTWWLGRKNVEDIAQKLGIDVVPIIGEGNLLEMVDFARYGFKSEWGHFIAEGIVARPLVELKDRAGERIITKIKHSDF